MRPRGGQRNCGLEPIAWFPREGVGEAGWAGLGLVSLDNACRPGASELPWLSSTWPWGDGDRPTQLQVGEAVKTMAGDMDF